MAAIPDGVVETPTGFTPEVGFLSERWRWVEVPVARFVLVDDPAGIGLQAMVKTAQVDQVVELGGTVISECLDVVGL